MNLSHLNTKNVVRAYSGEKGCMCGCLGKYYEDEKGIQRIINKIKRAIDSGALYSNDYKFDFDSDGVFMAVYRTTYKYSRRCGTRKERTGRYYCLYFD